MSNLTDFFPSGGGGLTPKFQEFTASGTFTPTQALIDAGGYIEVFLVGGGKGGENDQSSQRWGGQGGEAQIVRMYLTSISACTVTIGAGGEQSSTGNPGGSGFFGGAAAGGVDVTSVGGSGGSSPSSLTLNAMISPSWPSYAWDAQRTISAGPGVNGYGAGGANQSMGGGAARGGTGSVKPNTGQGGTGGNNPENSSNGASGYCLIKWYE